MELAVLHATTEASDVLPALNELDHTYTHYAYAAFSEAALLEAIHRRQPACIVLDATRSLAEARSLASTLTPITPVLAVFTPATLALLSAEWEVTEIILHDATPVEVRARLARACSQSSQNRGTSAQLARGNLVVDPSSYSAVLHGKPLDLTFKEFELLRTLAENPGRVFSREQLLERVWGFDYVGGERTVDVHIRRLRAKLGPEHGELIGTVRNVGYRFLAR